jgi:hypothetical protein
MTYTVVYIDAIGDVVRLPLNFQRPDRSLLISLIAGRRSGRKPSGESASRNSPKSEQACPASDECWRVPIANFADFAQPFAQTDFCHFQNKILIVDGHKPSAASVDIASGARSTVLGHSSEIICVSEHKGWVATAGKDAIVNLAAVNNLFAPLFSIPLYRDQIMCCTLNADFGIVASGTRDGFLVLGSLNRGSTVRVIDLLGCRPYALLITNAWGFIVVAATKLEAGRLEHVLMVFNVNGEFVRKCGLEHTMAVWTTWSSPDGFDYMGIASDQGKVSVCEAFWLNLRTVKLAHVAPPIIAMSYSQNDLGFVIAAASGEIAFVPFVQPR